MLTDGKAMWGSGCRGNPGCLPQIPAHPSLLLYSRAVCFLCGMAPALSDGSAGSHQLTRCVLISTRPVKRIKLEQRRASKVSYHFFFKFYTSMRKYLAV